jgi:hypothetical protein
MKKIMRLASRAPAIAPPIPIPAAAPAGTFELVEPFDEGLELVAEPVLVGSVLVVVGIVDEVAEGVEALAELDERLRGRKTQTLFEQADN